MFAGRLARIQLNSVGLRHPRVFTLSKPVFVNLFSTLGTTPATEKKDGFFSWSRITAGDGFNRWRVVPSALCLQLSVGSVYAWSVFNGPLTRELGGVVSAAGDWSLATVVPVFSVTASCFGLMTAFAGSWLERVGPRKVSSLAAGLWSGGLCVASVGVSLHNLPLLYLGYGVLGGAGAGLAYVSPVSTLIKWFPDRRGMATGLAVMGFGGGAVIGAPMNELLIKRFSEQPTFLGSVHDVHTSVGEGGRLFAQLGSQLQEVVVATAADVVAFGGTEGVYLVGSGNSGVSSTFAVLGLGYLCVMTIGALTLRVPRPGWTPKGWVPPPSSPMISHNHVHIDQTLRTPQFYLLWSAVVCNSFAGVCMLSTAKTLIGEVFGTTMPLLVNSAFAAAFVAGLSICNMGGRFCWAAGSDFFGRKNTFAMFGLVGAPLCFLFPYLTVAAAPDAAWALYSFLGGSCLLVSFYGGMFSVLPAYLADLFGTKFVGGIHGRLLTAWSTAAALGPTLLSHLRQTEYAKNVHTLSGQLQPHQFQQAFGAPPAQLDQLLAAKTVTIPRLMELLPPGTPDPTPCLYDSTFYTLSAVFVVGLVCNALIRPVHHRHHMTEAEEAAAERKS